MLMWTLAAVAGGAFLIDRAALMTMRPPRRQSERSAADLGYPITPIEVTTDGVTIRGDLMEPETATPAAAIVVLVHGWTGDSSTMLHLAEPLLADGLSVVLFDVRSHGLSDRAPAVTVRHFRDDLMAVLEWTRAQRPARNIVVVGHSLGGSAAILARARGAPIDGLALVASPADLFAATAGFFSDHGLPGGLLVKLFHPSWRLRAGESFSYLDPEARARDIAGTIPIEIVQGDQDTRVPPSEAVRLSAATGVPVFTVEGGGHRDVLVSPDVHKEILRFVRSVGGPLPAN
jgi:pimeloyl-ACP methyl ester carboxylesterase